MTDRELIGEYVKVASQQAFGELVRRHAGWVYGCARRRVRDADSAEDVTQAVFVLLSQNAGKLEGYQRLAAWLFKATHFCSANVIKQQARRRMHEREAAMRQAMSAGGEGADWEEIWPVLDEAVGKLGSADREAVLLRFYQGMSVSELAAAIGTGEEAAKKRVQRAVEKLRGVLAKKGVVAGAGALGVILAEKVTAAAPAGLVEAATAAAGGGGMGSAGVIAKGAMKMMVWAKVKVAVAMVVAAVAVVGTEVAVESKARSSGPPDGPTADAPATRPSKLDTYAASLKARGEPTTPADIICAPVPDNDNAVWYLKQAAATLVPERSGPRSSSLEYGPALPYGAQWDQQAEEMMQAHRRVFELAKEGSKHPKVDWDIRFEVIDGVNAPKPPSLAPPRALQNVLADAILYHHFRGDDASALDATQDALFAADAMGECPLLCCYMVNRGMQAVTDESIQIIATGLTIQDAAHPSNPATTHGAKREQVEKLIRMLLDDDRLRQQYRKAFESDRMVALADARSREAAGQAIDLQAVEKRLGAMDEAVESTRRPRVTPISPHSTSYIDAVRRWLFDTILSHRTAAVGLAVRLYWNDTGHYPATLAELVPKYLPAIPSDPLAKTERPLGYLLAEGGKRPIIWSVGLNGVPEKWGQAAIPSPPSYSPKSLQGQDADDRWVDLSAWR